MSSRISTLPEELLFLIRHGENYQIEYKEARTDLPKSLFDSVCSFSNREGGDIFLDVHDTGVVFGVDPSSAAKLITSFATLANNKERSFRRSICRPENTFSHDKGWSGDFTFGKWSSQW